MESPVFTSFSDKDSDFFEEELAVVISSCDRYSDLWAPFFFFFFRYWRDCPYPVFLVANHKKYDDPRVTTVLVGEDLDWSSNLKRALLNIRYPYVLLLLDDYFFTGHVNSKRIHDLFLYMKRKGAGCLRLFPTPGPDIVCDDRPDVGELLKGAEYRLSLQAAIWNKEIFLGLLRKGESPWYLEMDGSRRTDALDMPFLSVTKQSPRPLPYLCTAVYRGRWVREAVELCNREGVPIPRSARKVASRFWYFKRAVYPRLKGKIARILRFSG